MNRIGTLFLAVFTLPVLSFAQIRLDPGLMQAGLEAISASTLTNAQVVNYSKQAIKEMDSKNPVAPANDPYAKAGLFERVDITAFRPTLGSL